MLEVLGVFWLYFPAQSSKHPFSSLYCRCHLALLNLLSHVSSCIIDVHPLVCPLRLYLCCTVFHLFSASFRLLCYFPLCIFSLSSPSRLSCLLMLIHLSPRCVQSSTCVSCAVVHCIMLSLHQLHCLQQLPCLVSFWGGGAQEAKTHLEIAAHVHSVCSFIIQHIFSQQWRNMHTKYLERKDKHSVHKHRPQTDTQQNPFDINNW